jgi:pimeloyl-ACP methyl ester carboxylesterase
VTGASGPDDVQINPPDAGAANEFPARPCDRVVRATDPAVPAGRPPLRLTPAPQRLRMHCRGLFVPTVTEVVNMARRSGAMRAWPLYVGLGVLVASLTGLAQVRPGAAPKETPKSQTPLTGMDPNRQRVPIPTADGVELDGTYYRANRTGRDTPCVLMIHRYGSDRSKGEWNALAQALQGQGFAVLTFDLRGHGGSTTVTQQFWNFPINARDVRTPGAKRPSTISFNDFRPSYFPWLVNDVIAARRFLEIKNDAGELNSNSIFVIGAQEGAALGLLFTAEEFTRSYTTGFVPLQSNGTTRIAGDDIAADIWLSLSLQPSLPGGMAPRLDVNAWLRAHPPIRERVPMAFIFGDQDQRAKNDADMVFRLLGTTGGRGGGERNRLDELVPIKGTNLAGAALLGQQGLGVNQRIIDYMRKVTAERKSIPWSKVDPDVNRLGLANLALLGFRLQ